MVNQRTMELDENVRKKFLQLLEILCFETVEFRQHVNLSCKLTLFVDDRTEYQYMLNHLINRSEEDVYKSRLTDKASQMDVEITDLAAQTRGDTDDTSGYEEDRLIKDEGELFTSDNEDDEEAEDFPNNILLGSPSSPVHDSVADEMMKEEDNQITCPLCLTSYTDKLLLEKHLQKCHDIGNIYTCTICEDVCMSSDALAEHMKEFHGLKEEKETLVRKSGRKCKWSSKKPDKRGKNNKSKPKKNTEKIKENTTNKSKVKSIKVKSIKVNSENIEDKYKYSCDLCGEKFKAKRTMYHHKHIHKEESKKNKKTPTEYVCDVCGKQFKARRTMYYHKRLHKEEPKVYTCTEPECNATFNHSHSFKIHKLKHAGSRPFQCHMCEKTYFTSYNLRLHVQGVHTDEKNYTCKTCGKHFSYPTSLRAHELLHEEGQRVSCKECGKSFTQNQALQYHIKSSHSVPGVYKCEECNKKFKSDIILQRHKRRHTSDGKRFMCDICARQFMFKSDLESHKIYHRDEKKFVCKVCGKAFKAYPTLYYHTFVHKEETPFQCAECGKAFKTRERCKAHERRHSNVKPFECEICHRCFLNKVELNKHKTSVHAAVKKFVCDLCGKAMARADNLKAHMKLHLNPDYKPRQSRKAKKEEKILEYNNHPGVHEKTVEECTFSVNNNSRDSASSNTGIHCEKNHFQNSEVYQSNLPHFPTIMPQLSQPEEQNMPLNLHHPSPDSSSFQLLHNVSSISIPHTPTSDPSNTGNQSSPLVSSLQPAHYMYTRPYMYPTGMQSQPGSSNRFYQQ